VRVPSRVCTFSHLRHVITTMGCQGYEPRKSRGSSRLAAGTHSPLVFSQHCGCLCWPKQTKMGPHPDSSETPENSTERHTIPTLDGYELIFLLSYLDSGPRMSISSLLCLIYSMGAIFRTSWMMERNLTQLRSSFWLMRLPAHT